LTKLNYIHQNPVRKNYVARPEDYLYSSASYYSGKTKQFLEVKHIFDVIGWGNAYEYGIIRR
jgi:hypothetical protein